MISGSLTTFYLLASTKSVYAKCGILVDANRRPNTELLMFRSKFMMCRRYIHWNRAPITALENGYPTLSPGLHLLRSFIHLKECRGKQNLPTPHSDVLLRNRGTSPSLQCQIKLVSARPRRKYRKLSTRCRASRSEREDKSRLIFMRAVRPRSCLSSGAPHPLNSRTLEVRTLGKGKNLGFWRQGTKCRTNTARRYSLPRRERMK